VTAVLFLFLQHAALGLLAMLPFVPARAGATFFKFCSATAVFMSAAGFGLLWRRFGWQGGPGAPGAGSYPLVAALALVVLACGVLYNRAEHFGWQRARLPLLAAALLAGAAQLVATARPGPGALIFATDLTSAWLLGASVAAMVLGHFYLVVLDLPITALRRLTVLLVVGLGLRAAVVAAAMLGPWQAGLDEAASVAGGVFSPDGIFVWMRLLFGLAGPLALIGFIWKTVEIRSTQSATGILYVQLFLVMAGELLAKYLRLAAGMPL